MSFHGTACTPSTTHWYMRPDNSEFLVNHDNFVARTGPSVPPTEQRKNCYLTAQVDVPSGYTFSVTGASYHGFAALDGGASGSLDTRYHFGDSPVPVLAKHPITGPPNAFSWDRTDTAVATLEWHRC
jgi:hypothetical protein